MNRKDEQEDLNVRLDIRVSSPHSRSTNRIQATTTGQGEVISLDPSMGKKEDDEIPLTEMGHLQTITETLRATPHIRSGKMGGSDTLYSSDGMSVYNDMKNEMSSVPATIITENCTVIDLPSKNMIVMYIYGVILVIDPLAYNDERHSVQNVIRVADYVNCPILGTPDMISHASVVSPGVVVMSFLNPPCVLSLNVNKEKMELAMVSSQYLENMDNRFVDDIAIVHGVVCESLEMKSKDRYCKRFTGTGKAILAAMFFILCVCLPLCLMFISSFAQNADTDGDFGLFVLLGLVAVVIASTLSMFLFFEQRKFHRIWDTLQMSKLYPYIQLHEAADILGACDDCYMKEYVHCLHSHTPCSKAKNN